MALFAWILSHILVAAGAIFFLLKAFRAATRGKYRAPSRITWKGALFNWALWPEAILKRKPAFRKITLESLQKAAIKNAKLSDFGDTWYETAFSHAADMLNRRKLSPLGKYVAFDSMMRRLVARLRFNEELKRVPPSVLEEKLVDPIFVLGLPRTGTTFLHHLLSLDDQVRCPTTYELFDVAPRIRGDPVADKKARIKYVQNGIDQLKSIVPHIEAIHEA